ncbi:hypothetical protein HPB50_010501 [Hyalomma asiaticum]|uniref:Uncharacterized protein n=1 Tax=Hyalomma asiaticum TaxID=266040 RepID=A0ACB7SDF7_HYAAI|nr:hypothetical protein HPB50_010501 [Hyalomma asiaticum]
MALQPRRPTDRNLESGSSSSSGQLPRKQAWLTLSNWSASVASSDATLSSTILKTSDQEADESRGGPSGPLSGRRGRSHTRSLRKGDDTSSSRPRRRSAERSRQSEDRSPSETPPRRKSGQSPVPSPASSGQGPTGRRSFWDEPSLSGEDTRRHVSHVRSPEPTGGQSSWATVHPHHEDGSRRLSPVVSPRSTGQSSRTVSYSFREDASRLRSPRSSTRSSRNGAMHSAKKDSLGTRRPREPAAVPSTPSAAATPARPKEPRKEKVKSTAAYRMLREIKQFRSGTRKLIPRRSFARVVREIVQRHSTRHRDLKMQRLALEALQDAGEALLVNILEGSYMIARNAHRVTLMLRDMTTLTDLIRRYGSMQVSLL